jgi:tagatose 1,6-diphosphate aldolase
MSHSLTIGKIRGLRQISDEHGIFTMAAEDQRGSMRKMLNPRDPKSVSPGQLTEIKLDIARSLSPLASAMLIDPEYGAAQAISTGALAGHCGLLVSLEDSDYEQVGDDRRARILDNWGVEKIKRMGASAVKLLVYFRPDRGPATTYQRDLVARVGDECRRHDIPFVLESVGYPVGGMNADSPEYAALKPQIVVESARMLSGLGVDIYKAEFPADSKYERDDGRLLALCKALDDACEVPWVVLSAGVDIDIFRDQVRLACRGGASGFLGGRAIWKQAIPLPADERRRFLSTEGVANLSGLMDIAHEHAHPWASRVNRAFGSEMIDDTWYRVY